MDNRKTKLSKRLLKEALIELLQTKSISQITIKELCDIADLNRSTFYAHYEDVYNLLSSIEDDIIDEMPTIFYSEKPSQKDILNYAAYIEKNYRTFIALMKNGNFINKSIEKSFEKYNSEFENIPEDKIHIFKFIANYYMGGLFQSLLYWSENNKILSLQEISEIIYLLLNESIKIRMNH